VLLEHQVKAMLVAMEILEVLKILQAAVVVVVVLEQLAEMELHHSRVVTEEVVLLLIRPGVQLLEQAKI
jgi:hypothetical protein